MFVSKSPVRIENNVLTALSFPREAHKSFNIQHMKLHSFPDYSPDSHRTDCVRGCDSASHRTDCVPGCDSASGISTVRARILPRPRNKGLQPFPQGTGWITMSSGQTLECMVSSSLPLVLHVWQFAEERVKHVWITKMAKWPFKSAVRTKVWNSRWPWPQAGPQGTFWVLL